MLEWLVRDGKPSMNWSAIHVHSIWDAGNRIFLFLEFGALGKTIDLLRMA